MFTAHGMWPARRRPRGVVATPSSPAGTAPVSNHTASPLNCSGGRESRTTVVALLDPARTSDEWATRPAPEPGYGVQVAARGRAGSVDIALPSASHLSRPPSRIETQSCPYTRHAHQRRNGPDPNSSAYATIELSSSIPDRCIAWANRLGDASMYA